MDGENLLAKSQEELTEVRRHKMGMVFQSFGLMPHLNVIDNVAFPLKLQGIKEESRYAQAERVIELVGLQGRETNFPNELSGGQQQRVGIARSLAVEPEIWLLDEPFSALDPLIRKKMQDEFLRIQSMLRKSIVFITAQEIPEQSPNQSPMLLGIGIFKPNPKIINIPKAAKKIAITLAKVMLSPNTKAAISVLHIGVR